MNSESIITEKFFAIAQAGHDITVWLLILLSILSVGFIIERWLSLRGVNQKTNSVNNRLQEALQSNSISEIEELGKDKDSLQGRALSYGLRHAKENGSEGLEEIFNAYALNEKPKLERYLNFLATVGSNAPFIGLLGTVFGIMDAFRGLATSQGDAAAVMIGISKALVATAIGLFVAIPAVIAYNYFRKQVGNTFTSLESVRDLCIAYAKSKKSV